MIYMPLIFGIIPVIRSTFIAIPIKNGIIIIQTFFLELPTRHLIQSVITAAIYRAYCHTVII